MGDIDTTDELPARAVKFVSPDTIEGLAMPFGRDTDDEEFTPQTDFCIDWYGKSGRPFLFDHGLDATLKSKVVGRQTDFEIRDEGVWAKVQLDRNARYRKAIDTLVEQGALGFSAGAMPHLARKNAKGEITRFPWVELSGTPIPSHPGALNLHYVKSADFMRRLEESDQTIPAPVKAALAALDEWADTRDDSPAESYADEGERVLLAAKAFADRSTDIAAMRAKSGRVLSGANRARLAELRERIAASSEHAATVIKDLDELLSSTDPEAQSGKSSVLLEAMLEALASESRLLGVDLPH